LRPFGIPVPLLGRLAQDTALARAAATLRLLLQYGVPVQEALRLSGEASGSRHVSLALRRAEYALREGGTLAQGLRQTGLLPESFVLSLASAEASGDLVATLGHLETDYRREVGQLARTWVVMAGPLIVVGLGLVVGSMILAIYMPLVAIIQQLSGS
jgi:type IV pilus assembly protein PilC